MIPKMSVFTLAISWLTTSNLPWFMDLTFQVPMHYCSVQHQTIHHQTYPQLGGISTSVHSLHSFWNYFSSNIWTPTDLGGSSFSVIPFCLFILFMGFSRQELWSGLPPASLVAQMVKKLSTMQETSVWSLGREDPLKKEMTTHSSIFSWRIPWTEEPIGLQFMGLQRIRHDCETNTSIV